MRGPHPVPHSSSVGGCGETAWARPSGPASAHHLLENRGAGAPERRSHSRLSGRPSTNRPHRRAPTAGTGRAHNGWAPLAASPDPTRRGRRDRGGRSHARVDRAHRDRTITGAGAPASNAQPAAAAPQQAAETPEPQMRGGTVDAVDDYLPLVGARSSTAVGGTLRMAATSWPLTRPSSRATPVCGSREDRRRLPRSVDVQPGEQAPTKATGTMNSRADT